MKIKLKIRRQENKDKKGQFRNYQLDNVNEHMSFLEMLDVLNEDLTQKGEEPVAFSHDCREGICGSCGMVINGNRMARRKVRRPASCTCANSKTATR